jgi:GDP-L-fucose synthase
MLSGNRIYVAGHRGMAGSAIVRALQTNEDIEIITRDRSGLDLTNETQTREFFEETKPNMVIFAAAKVGGIQANQQSPVDFMVQNLRMTTNAIQLAFETGVTRFLYLGSTCIYPRMAPQPLSEESLLDGKLEPTNEAYAIAKIVGVKLCQYYRKQHGVCFHSVMPTNLYGPGDNYHSENSHVLPGLLRRFHEAKEEGRPSVTVWGSGNPRREFLHVDDLASAVRHLIQLPNPPDWINVGTGVDISIVDLARKIADVVGYRGSIEFDSSKPDGIPQKLTSITLLRSTGWTPSINLDEGLRRTFEHFQSEILSGVVRTN